MQFGHDAVRPAVRQRGNETSVVNLSFITARPRHVDFNIHEKGAKSR